MKLSTIPTLRRSPRVPSTAPTMRAVLILMLIAAAASVNAEPAPPDVGQRASDFALQPPEGATVNFNGLLKKSKIVLIGAASENGPYRTLMQGKTETHRPDEMTSVIDEAASDLPRFSQPTIVGVSRFKFVGEYNSPPSSWLWGCGKRCLLSTSP